MSLNDIHTFSMGPDDGSSHVPPSALLSQPNYSSLEPNTCSERKTAVDVILDHLKVLQQNGLFALQMDVVSELLRKHSAIFRYLEWILDQFCQSSTSLPSQTVSQFTGRFTDRPGQRRQWWKNR